MKSLVIYYSYSGSTRVEALREAAEQDADLVEVLDEKRPGTIGAFMRCASALGMKCTPIQPLAANLEAYEDIIIMAPVWAGFPAPAINNVIRALPGGKDVEVHLVSASGQSSCHRKVEAAIRQRGCNLTRWRDIRRG